MLIRTSPSAPTRAAYIRQIEDALGHRKLYWFGPRGADGRALLSVDQFDGSFSIMAPLEAVSVGRDVCLETLTKQRVDHNTYSFDNDQSEALREFRTQLLDALRFPAAVVPYRPNRFLSNILFPRTDTTTYLGLFHEQQSPFEHKPWVETELRQVGVRTLPWVYFADEDRPRLLEYLERIGPIVLRASRSDGGARIDLVTTPEELRHHMPTHDDGFLCACRYFERATPLNINGCIFHDGRITLHGLSEQIIGHPGLTRRRFGYCGNKFGIGRDLPRQIIDQFEKYTLATGQWLHRQGYTGVFGVDALIEDDQVYVVEVNPRFQGSSFAVAAMESSSGIPDLYLSQIAAFLNLPAPESIPLFEIASCQQATSLAIVYNLSAGAARRDPEHRLEPASGVRLDLLPALDIDVSPEAIIARLMLDANTRIGDPGTTAFIHIIQGAPVQSALFEGPTVL